MDSRQSGVSGLIPAATARGIGLAGLVLIALYLSIVVGAAFPLQLLNPSWLLRVGSGLINASPFPLIALVLLHLAADLQPGDALLNNRRRIAAQLAVPVSIGFLLLAPLLSGAAVAEQHQEVARRSDWLQRGEANLQSLRQALATSASFPELEDRLRSINGPRLDAADRSQPLPVVKAKVAGLLDQAAAQLDRQRLRLPSGNPLALLPQLLRHAFACLALALGFAGLARRPGSTISVLAELQDSWIRRRWRRVTGVHEGEQRLRGQRPFFGLGRPAKPPKPRNPWR